MENESSDTNSNDKEIMDKVEKLLENNMYVHDVIYDSLMPNTFDFEGEHFKEIDKPNCKYLFNYTHFYIYINQIFYILIEILTACVYIEVKYSLFLIIICDLCFIYVL